jgi:hypothetical protein
MRQRLRNFNGQCLKLEGKDMELDEIERCDGKFGTHNKLVVKTSRGPIIRRIWTVLVVTTGIICRQTREKSVIVCTILLTLGVSFFYSPYY